MKQPIYVAFSTQKGGAGKTTLTVLVASYLHYVRGKNVAVIDCDYPQHSIAEMRERDFKMVSDDEFYKGMAYEQVTRLGGKKFYPIVESNPQEALNDADELCEKEEFDYIFFDLPGTLNNKDLIIALANMDYIIAPIAADRVVMESTLNYMISVRDNIVNSGKSNIKSMYLLWNMVDGREKSDLYDVYERVIKELEFATLKTFIPNSLRFRREQSESRRPLFRSTLFPVDRSLVRGSNIEELSDELVEILK
ncbi:ParA family protein [Parabacteroides sp.]